MLIYDCSHGSEYCKLTSQGGEYCELTSHGSEYCNLILVMVVNTVI